MSPAGALEDAIRRIVREELGKAGLAVQETAPTPPKRAITDIDRQRAMQALRRHGVAVSQPKPQAKAGG